MSALNVVPKFNSASLLGKDIADLEPARTLVEQLNAAGRRSTSEMLSELRRAFPDAPLSVRVAALSALRVR